MYELDMLSLIEHSRKEIDTLMEHWYNPLWEEQPFEELIECPEWLAYQRIVAALGSIELAVETILEPEE